MFIAFVNDNDNHLQKLMIIVLNYKLNNITELVNGY